MRRIVAGTIIVVGLAGCTPSQVADNVSTVCTDMAKMPVDARAVLDQQDPHSVLGVLWADAKSACLNGAPTPGVSMSWGGMVWGEFKATVPQLLPMLVPLLVGLL